MRSLLGNFKEVFRSKEKDQNILFLNQCFEIQIKRPELYKLALVHRSSSQPTDNERLELLGDAVLDLVVADYLYQHYPEMNEGELTKLKAKLISRDQLNKIGHDIGLTENIELIKQNDLDSSLIIGNVLEAIFGAIYLERGFEVSSKVGIKMFETNCDISELLENLHDAKSLLLEWSQKKKKNIRFRVMPNGEDEFMATVFVGEMLIAKGKGKSKKKAEKAAARRALEVIEIIE